MLYTFVRFRHAADIAWLTMRLYDSREEGDLITEARIGYTLEAVLSVTGDARRRDDAGRIS